MPVNGLGRKQTGHIGLSEAATDHEYLGERIGPTIAKRDSAPVYTPVSYAAIGNDKIGEIAQEPVMPPALTCIRGEDKR
jgi:hypothetical protein